MKDALELIAEYLPVERLHALRRAVETLRDCAKDAMINARQAGDDRISRICRGAYTATCHQLKTVERVLMTKEGRQST